MRAALPSLSAFSVALLLAGPPARAAGDNSETPPAPPAFLPQKSAPPLLAINGFGTVGAVHSTEERADFVFDNLQPFGAGRTADWSTNVDSRLGLQLTLNLTPQLTGMVQLVSEYSWSNDYRPVVSWANLKYAFTPDFSVRVGRIGLASFLASDSRRVGYSNITARPPTEVYRLLALRDSDGIDAAWRSHFSGMTNNFSLLYGKRTVTNTRGIHVHSTDVRGIFDTLQSGPLTLHAAYQLRNVDNQNPPLGRFVSLGASYDPGTWFAAAEWVRAANYDARRLLVKRAGWYINGGVRWHELTPYATYSALVPQSDTGAPPVAQRTVAAGVRWDVTRNVDLKLQADHVRLGANSYGTLQNVLPGTPRGGSFNLVSVVADFLF